jgi:peptide/nickel transport system substrate-binding protein
MVMYEKGLTRREFLEVAAVGAAGTAAYGLGVPQLFAATPKRGGTVLCGMTFLIQTPDPHRYTGAWARQCMAPTYEGLTTPTPLGERLKLLEEQGPDAAIPDVKPMLADAWEIEKGGTRYVFHLKKNVLFHNGKEFGSEDVKWNWDRIKDPANQSTVRKFTTLFYESADTPDKYTVVANLSKPYGSFLMANAWCFCSILPKDCIPHGTIWGFTPTFKPPTAAPPGTGPFVFSEYQQKRQAVFTRFKDYRIKGLPFLDKVIFKVISENGPRTMALRSGDLHYIYGVESNYLEKNIKGKKINRLITVEKDNVMLYPVLGGGAQTIYLNCNDQKSPHFKNEKVRQALDYCIDKEKLAKTLFGNMGVPMYQPHHPDNSSWGYRDIKYRKPDIEKAKQLLKEAGYPDGLDVEFKITPSWGRNDIRAQIVQQMAKPAGFRIKITPQVGVQYWLNLRKYTFDMLMYSSGGEDPMRVTYGYMHTDPAKPYNGYAPATGVKDPEMDKLLEAVAEETDLQKRKAIYKKVINRINEKAYWIFNNANIGSNGWSSKLKNFKPWEYYAPEQAFVEAWLEA